MLVELETPGTNRKQVLFGVVPRRHKRSGDFQALVDAEILTAYPHAEFIFLTVDGASIYASKSTRVWLRQHPQFVPVPLPSYAPKLNPQEQIRRWMQAEVTHSNFFGSLAAELAAVMRFFAQLAEQPQRVLQ